MAGDLQQWTVEEPYVNLHCGLGEGPYYEAVSNTLRFVDIINKRLHAVSLDEGPASLKTVQLDTPVSVTADIEGVDPRAKILVGIKYGIAVLDRNTEQYELISRFAEGIEEHNQRVRGNDGSVDPHGRFWLGTMTDFGVGPFESEGALFRFDARKPRELFKGDMTIPNSIGWSPDSKTMYFTDTVAKEVLAYDYSLSDGGVSNERVFYKHDGPGGPDGFRVDKEGNIWHAIYGESRVIKISPAGKVVGQVTLPTRNITCTQFVGTELFITTASDDEGEGQSKEYGGGLFKIDVGATGLEEFKFKLDA